MKKILLMIATIMFIHSNVILSKIQDGRWKTIAIDIADEGFKNDRGEFEAAKQALLNTNKQALADGAAKRISERWTQSDDVKLRKEAELDALKKPKRYPTMSEDDVLEAAVMLFEETNIDNFLIKEKIKVDTSEAKIELQKRKTS